MKKIKPGWNDPAGFPVQCNCGCEFLIEDKYDMTIGFCFDTIEQEIYSGYYATCPSCGAEVEVGYKGHLPYLNYALFERDDFNERFSLEDVLPKDEISNDFWEAFYSEIWKKIYRAER